MSLHHPLDDATQLNLRADGILTGTTSDAYWNMAGPFGGVTAAILLRGVLDQPERGSDPVSLTVNYCGPIDRGPFDVRVRRVRAGKSTEHWAAELVQERGTAAIALVICGRRRQVWNHQPATPPRTLPPAKLAALEPVGPMQWLRRYRFRFAEGGLRIGDRASLEKAAPAAARSVVWFEDVPARPLDYVSLAALSDAFFLRILHVRSYLVPVATVTLTTYFHADPATLRAHGEAPVLGVADAQVFSSGFFDQTAQLWSGERLLATSTQLVWYRE